MENKEQEAEQKKETERKRKFAKDVFYPFLLTNSKNIHDAQIMCEVMAQAIQQKFNLTLMEEQKRVSKLPLAELKLETEMKPDTEFDRDRALLAVFKDETVAVTVELMGGMGKAIEGFIKEESSGRPLIDLKTHFL